MNPVPLRILSLFLCSLAALMVGCQSEKPSGQVYHSPLDNFTCKVPKLTHPGDKQKEQSDADTATVEFSDDLGSLLRIETIRIPSDSLENFTGPEARQTIDNTFDNVIFPNTFGAVSSRTTTLRREHVDTAAGPALFVVVNIPGGSTLANTDTAQNGKRLDSTRGVLLFVQQGFLYEIQNQEWPSAPQISHETMQQRTDALLNDLKQTVAGMTFSKGK